MSRGKYLSLEEARKLGKLDQFAKEHAAEGDEAEFDHVLIRIASGDTSRINKGGKHGQKGNKSR